MDHHRLRSAGDKKVFSGFTTAEMEKMDRMLKESGKVPNLEVIKRLTTRFNGSAGRAGKPLLKWTEVRNWFLYKHGIMSNDTSHTVPNNSPPVQEACVMNETSDISKGEKFIDLSKLEFEAKSSDGAWYDVEIFITYRFISSSGYEVLVRYDGFGPEEDEWVHVKNVRERSVPLEHSECDKITVGDTVLCFQEKTDMARHYDAQILDIQRKLHDIRGCRCIFLIRYEHDNSEESVRLKRLCCRPEY
ncbi:putative Chromo-like domain superfamily, SAWADEE domain, protein SAWADEE HOMEODOMAIN 1/2 [Helianthus annuus]|uniref:Chromo-like domain superfamily, SAWADEE domain, protein SAWADEE HOMEODOMAIN 1/2 n=1 Tax=Helianthus annuus TaxID=4232 RepID=A0A251VH05_HELAN|nr:protein SAWADEE HOMEODOMAIN HOMOLOG 1 [Helianthus annuus]KAF5819292.1 putative Chromo-like domain superfamily, SAWADEE domain, protein SAWADEE HOMEODOMAIN 1/2 [Helianthus annuus]KAJ0619473.1 putative chromatin remodeling & transcriptional activation CHROMO-DOMAIN family [Helianthus annuus]KAJ0952552.1 putative chromatin remodeling & transcriptional activation CHROMO-DOMAIN family [Helianthus annuus]